MRSNYWSCSKFADWLRGTDKPPAATSEGWRSWRLASKKTHPIRHWIVEEGLDNLQRYIHWPTDKLNDVRYYINNRWVTRSHSLTAHARDIKPGAWCDVGNRFLPCMFNELVDFVEVESAWMHVVWNDENRDKYNVPFWRKQWWTRWGMVWRCKEAGLDHLNWAAQLRFDDEFIEQDNPSYGKFTPQALNAQEILSLYTWWTEKRPARPDPYEVSGWSALCAERRAARRAETGDDKDDFFISDEKTPEAKQKTRDALDTLHKLETEYEQEDEEMMIRLIKVRHGLWT
jgi:hypothetical protein